MLDGYLDRYKPDSWEKDNKLYNMDYQETFIPVPKMNMLRILMSLSTNFDWYEAI